MGLSCVQFMKENHVRWFRGEVLQYDVKAGEIFLANRYSLIRSTPKIENHFPSNEGTVGLCPSRMDINTATYSRVCLMWRSRLHREPAPLLHMLTQCQCQPVSILARNFDSHYQWPRAVSINTTSHSFRQPQYKAVLCKKM